MGLGSPIDDLEERCRLGSFSGFALLFATFFCLSLIRQFRLALWAQLFERSVEHTVAKFKLLYDPRCRLACEWAIFQLVWLGCLNLSFLRALRSRVCQQRVSVRIN